VDVGWSLPSEAHALWHETCCPLPVRHNPIPADDAPAPAPMQRVVKVRRDYNNWVASETMEDYALRFTPQRFRRVVASGGWPTPPLAPRPS